MPGPRDTKAGANVANVEPMKYDGGMLCAAIRGPGRTAHAEIRAESGAPGEAGSPL